MDRFFIFDQSEYDHFKAQLVERGNNQSTLETYYYDPVTGSDWLSYPISERFGWQLCLMRLPEPDYHTLLGLSLNSRYEDEALAASHKLAGHIDIYHELIGSLENAFDPGNKETLKRIEVVLKACSLTSQTNRREVVGKKYQQVENDAKYFRDISLRAKWLKNKVENILG
jgi:hypothetical protein